MSTVSLYLLSTHMFTMCLPVLFIQYVHICTYFCCLPNFSMSNLLSGCQFICPHVYFSIGTCFFLCVFSLSLLFLAFLVFHVSLPLYFSFSFSLPFFLFVSLLSLFLLFLCTFSFMSLFSIYLSSSCIVYSIAWLVSTQLFFPYVPFLSLLLSPPPFLTPRKRNKSSCNNKYFLIAGRHLYFLHGLH